ncbi:MULTISPECIES: exodeoxyribonuclease VII large subunit [unclassified Ruminococcus]|uniref:exodeoxyribonuclease VII large subunit n=1 Tax=unclassified Ruminococcus TaxID=2608920 RepID=UPI0021094363|nr:MULTISPECIES: exodeoxyribonuclease VII large subunit [unclassified Ruminococcus]
MSVGILTVSQINFYIKSIIDNDPKLKTVFVCGELSNFTRHYKSGHLYFSLKDDKAVIKSVMFSFAASRLRFAPSDGMKVIVRGKISVYEPSGQYQLYVEDMQPDGAGALALAYEQLKSKLENEGLFGVEHKKPLPPFPERVGVITSPTGAARRDIENIISRRYPSAEIILYPVTVQGDTAPGQLIRALEYMDSKSDVIIIGRGGGSAEDLWAFNDEGLARKIFDCKTPVISAVGHETDFTICDFVSDMRAPTPSAAAELAVPDREELLNSIMQRRFTLLQLMKSRINNGEEKLRAVRRSVLFSPEKYIAEQSLKADVCTRRFKSAVDKYISDKENSLKYSAAALMHLSPLNILSRGYALPTKDGKTVKSVKEISLGEKFRLILNDGSVNCIAEEING